MPNHLIKEKSPYLLQHAENPVDWYPWGEEAFERSRALDLPIFLSIGYATCHWCHVMEKESFENTDVARLMNEAFINIKVDREELPEIDNLYMEFAQALMSSAGGWPLNLVLTPDLKPFFAVTYLPPKTQRGMLGIDQFIKQIQQLWKSEERTLIIEQAEKLVDIFERAKKTTGDELPDTDLLEACIDGLYELIDPVSGGFKGEPKFPLSYQCDFLLAFAKESKESRALYCVEITLDSMARGGIYDHLGGGFSRYSVDEKWHIPHFEKMLYDNALLAKTYLNGWQYTKKDAYRQTCKEILDSILREMTSSEGGFYSAEDADTEGHEGRFYTWTQKEISSALTPDQAALFCAYYGIEAEGHFEGRSVLCTQASLEEFAEMRHLSLASVFQLLQEAKEKLFKVRETRCKPFKDDKILTGWNGLMVDSLCKAGSVFEEESYQQAALKCARFLKSVLWKEGRLLRRYRDGEARFNAVLDDYASLIKGLLTLFEEQGGIEWLEWAIELSAVLEKEFKAPDGAFYLTNAAQDVLIRKCEFYDGSEPSGNSVHCENLIRLFQITQEERYIKQVEDILKASKQFMEAYPPGACYHLMALSRYLNNKAATVVIALDEKETFAKEIARFLSAHYSPHTAVIWKKSSDSALAALLKTRQEQTPVNGKTAVYICTNDDCELPLLTLEEILKRIEHL